MGMFSELARKEGILSLWKGNSAAVMRVVPYLSMQFLSLEKYKEAIKEKYAPARHIHMHRTPPPLTWTFAARVGMALARVGMAPWRVSVFLEFACP